MHLLIVPKRHLAHLLADAGADDAELLGAARPDDRATELAREAGLERRASVWS